MSQASLRLAIKSCLTGLLGLCSTLAMADLKIQTRHSAMGHDSESTTYIKGARQRMEQGVAGMSYRSVTIYQCDLKRMITINDAAKTYSITNIDVDPPAAPEPATGAAHRPASPKAEREETENADQSPAEKGGSRVMTFASIDTYERQQMFGYNARHIRTLMAMDTSEDACSKEEMMMETDGWYIDMQYPFRCSVKYRPPVQPSSATHGEKPSCSDKFGMYTCYKGAHKGFPLKEVTKIYTKEGQRMSMTQETVDLSSNVLDPKLFDIPAGYTEVQSMSAMGMGGGMTREQAMEMARQQQAQNANNGSGSSSSGSSNSGGLTAGGKWKKSSGESTAASTDSSASNSSADASNSGGLLAGGKWKKSGGDSANASSTGASAATGKQPGAVRVGVLAITNKSGQSTSDMTQTLIDDLTSMQLDVVTLTGDAVADCKAKDCDDILSADIVALKPVGKKGGGFFGKMIGQGEGSGAFEAVVAYKMFAPDGNTLKLDGTQNAREGTTAEESMGAVLRRVSAEVVKTIRK